MLPQMASGTGTPSRGGAGRPSTRPDGQAGGTGCAAVRGAVQLPGALACPDDGRLIRCEALLAVHAERDVEDICDYIAEYDSRKNADYVLGRVPEANVPCCST